MCCCIPLRRLSYLGAIGHMSLGLLYLYFLGSVCYTLYNMRDHEKYGEQVIMGMIYIGYYAAFLPPGILIFWGVHKKIRCYIVIPSICFLIIQIYGLGIVSYFGFRPHWLPDAIRKFNNSGELNKLRAGFWMDVSIQLTVTIVYLFMLFFYYREIGPESSPPQSRYVQAYNQQHETQQLQQLQHNHPLTHHTHAHHHQQLHQQHSHHSQQQLPLGPPVPFRPVTLPPGSLAASNTNLNRNSTPCPQGPISLASIANSLTFEQQQQLLKLQNHPLIIQQHQQLQQQLQQQQLHQSHHHQQHSHHSHAGSEGEAQIPMQSHPLFHSQYMHMLSSQQDPTKTPKF